MFVKFKLSYTSRTMDRVNEIAAGMAEAKREGDEVLAARKNE